MIDIATVGLSQKSATQKNFSNSAKVDGGHQAENSQPSNQKSLGQPFLLPLPANLRYATFVNGNSNQDANIVWGHDGDRYKLDVKFWMPIIGEISFKSEGTLDSYGISPNLYEEKIGKRVRAVYFDRVQNQLQMTTNNESAQIPLGVQDRFSVIFQLAALVKGNPDIDERGVARVIPIADIRRVDEWVFVSGGDMPIMSPNGKEVLTRYFRRQARSVDDRRGLEVWLAKEYDWLPMKITQTEPNGTIYELNLIQYQISN